MSYSRNAGPRLKALLEEMKRTSPDERLSLLEEVDLTRLAAERYLQVFERVVLTPPAEGEPEPSPELKGAATMGLRQAMADVAAIVEKAAKVRAISSSVVDAEGVAYVVAQVNKAIDKVVPPGPDRDRLIKEIENIRLPEREVKILV